MASGSEVTEKEMMSKSKRQLPLVKDPIEKIRLTCLSRGSSGIKRIGTLFRIADDDRSRRISLEEFSKLVRDFGVELQEDEVKTAFDGFDTDHSGQINFDEFLAHLRPPMSNGRKSIIEQAFHKMDKTDDGVITVADMKGVYNAKHHPKFENGEWSEQQVFETFLKNFDSPTEPDCKVTKDEFLDYYSGVSASIDNDMYFDVMMRRSWKL